MSKSFTFCAAICAALLTGSLAFAAAGDGYGDQQGRGFRGQQPWGQQLTPQQRQQAEKIFNDNFNSMDETRQALAAKRQALDAELQSDNPDPAKIESLSREIGELRGKMLAARVNVRSQLANEGLPQDFYGPGAPRGKNNWQRGPEVWHGGHRGHGHGGPRGPKGQRGWGCPGGCW